jgi:hypothetical protein
MYGQFDADRQLTDFYSKLGFNVHPVGAAIGIPKDLGLASSMLGSLPNDQWFEQALQPSGIKPAS